MSFYDAITAVDNALATVDHYVLKGAGYIKTRGFGFLFFDTYQIDGHVGIYIGNGKYIGAQSSTGVAIADMSRGYWKQKFNGRVKRL